ncbi:hypothetical protein ACXR2T_09925 [Leucobacter sp. HY1910]
MNNEVDEDLALLGFEEPSSDTVPTVVRGKSHYAPRRQHRKRWWFTGLSALAAIVIALIILAASTVLVGTVAAPELTNKIIGEAATSVTHAARTVAKTEPRVVLGGDGGQAEVDACPGSWTRMIAYNQNTGFEVPVYSAHNGCWGTDGRGDVILPLGIGDKINIVDNTGERLYRVIEMIDRPQRTSTTDDINTLTGPIILQTCYWDDQTMKFVSVEPVI